ncbi:ATPase [Polymorphobacter sp. PAMC 29334]|uniref:F0F1 ATP synthase subunit B family protein n=1 Tax=Polymorphobacter sp. PAMC 29334 TaxID=2862331 RepID=UPI001C777747|nr:ATPase [Polymorphobacter sp. PAMC 29334]QYE34444.1 ATPase [Polymorphobacter sp. PAMC 29334]
MPQFDPSVAVPQIAWLIAVFAILYLIVRASLPKVERVALNRAGVIGDDLNHAEMAKSSAGAVIAEYEATLATARAAAMKLAGDAKTATSGETAAKLKAVEAELAAKTAGAAARIEAAKGEALANLRIVAEDATADIVERLTGRRPAADEVAATVAAVAA